MGFPDSSVGKESACNVEDLGLIHGLGRSPGEGKGYPLQYSGLENSLDCIVQEIAKSRTRLSDFPFHFDVHGPDEAFPGGLDSKESTGNAGDLEQAGDLGLTPGWGRASGERNGFPL